MADLVEIKLDLFEGRVSFLSFGDLPPKDWPTVEVRDYGCSSDDSRGRLVKACPSYTSVKFCGRLPEEFDIVIGLYGQLAVVEEGPPDLKVLVRALDGEVQ